MAAGGASMFEHLASSDPPRVALELFDLCTSFRPKSNQTIAGEMVSLKLSALALLALQAYNALAQIDVCLSKSSEATVTNPSLR